MSFVDVSDYLESVITQADSNFKEWTDAFADNNIPSTKINMAFTIGDFNFGQIKQNQLVLDVSGSATVKLYFKAFRDVGSCERTALTKALLVIKKALLASNRLTQDSIKNVKVLSLRTGPYSNSNDNIVVATIEFGLDLVLEIES